MINWQSVGQALNPYMILISSIISIFVTYKITGVKSRKEDRQRIYKEQLLKFYQPVHRIRYELKLNIRKSRNVESINIFVEMVWPYLDKYAVLVPESLQFVFDRLKESLISGTSKKSIARYNEFDYQVEGQYYRIKKKLGYPSIGLIRQSFSWPPLTQVLFWLSFLLMVIGAIIWLGMNISKTYTILPLCLAIIFVALGFACFIIFLKRDV